VTEEAEVGDQEGEESTTTTCKDGEAATVRGNRKLKISMG
jgi:hypothetical protein